MAQGEAWEREYRSPKLVTRASKPQADTIRFARFLRNKGVNLASSSVLDLGSGTGRNGNYFAGLGAEVVGLELSETAVKLAVESARGTSLRAKYFQHDIGSPYPLPDASFDVALDVVSSNSLSEDEREVCVLEVHRILKPGGWFFVKALCKDGDRNAKNLLKDSPGEEKDTYVIEEMGLTERVWSRDDFAEYYSPFFEIAELKKKTNYARFNNRSYKRNYWIAYLKNK